MTRKHDFTDPQLNHMLCHCPVVKRLNLWPAIFTLAVAIVGLLIFGYVDEVWGMVL